MGPESNKSIPQDERGSPDGDIPSFDLLKFINDQSDVFVVVGVFAAAAIYVSNFSPEPITTAAPEYRYGFFGALSIVALLIILLYQKLSEQFEGPLKLLFAHTTRENWDLILFSLGMGLFFYSIVSTLTARGYAFFMFLRILYSIAGIGFYFWILNIAGNLSDDEQSEAEGFAIIAVVSLLVTTLSHRVYISTNAAYQWSPESFQFLNPPSLTFALLWKEASHAIWLTSAVFVVLSSVGLVGIIAQCIENYVRQIVSDATEYVTRYYR